jgi:Xaa-Pro aminopeptidase
MVLNFSREQQHFIGLSFTTISSMGPNAAVIHYKPEFLTAAKINANEIYLCDSGAQYRFVSPFNFQSPCSLCKRLINE